MMWLWRTCAVLAFLALVVLPIAGVLYELGIR